MSCLIRDIINESEDFYATGVAIKWNFYIRQENEFVEIEKSGLYDITCKYNNNKLNFRNARTKITEYYNIFNTLVFSDPSDGTRLSLVVNRIYNVDIVNGKIYLEFEMHPSAQVYAFDIRKPIHSGKASISFEERSEDKLLNLIRKNLIVGQDFKIPRCIQCNGVKTLKGNVNLDAETSEADFICMDCHRIANRFFKVLLKEVLKTKGREEMSNKRASLVSLANGGKSFAIDIDDSKLQGFYDTLIVQINHLSGAIDKNSALKLLLRLLRESKQNNYQSLSNYINEVKDNLKSLSESEEGNHTKVLNKSNLSEMERIQKSIQSEHEKKTDYSKYVKENPLETEQKQGIGVPKINPDVIMQKEELKIEDSISKPPTIQSDTQEIESATVDLGNGDIDQLDVLESEVAQIIKNTNTQQDSKEKDIADTYSEETQLDELDVLESEVTQIIENTPTEPETRKAQRTDPSPETEDLDELDVLESEVAQIMDYSSGITNTAEHIPEETINKTTKNNNEKELPDITLPNVQATLREMQEVLKLQADENSTITNQEVVDKLKTLKLKLINSKNRLPQQPNAATSEIIESIDSDEDKLSPEVIERIKALEEIEKEPPETVVKERPTELEKPYIPPAPNKIKQSILSNQIPPPPPPSSLHPPKIITEPKLSEEFPSPKDSAEEETPPVQADSSASMDNSGLPSFLKPPEEESKELDKESIQEDFPEKPEESISEQKILVEKQIKEENQEDAKQRPVESSSSEVATQIASEIEDNKNFGFMDVSFKKTKELKSFNPFTNETSSGAKLKLVVNQKDSRRTTKICAFCGAVVKRTETICPGCGSPID
ncbi:MAG: hypothetical protein GF364_06900 [Candidatus Lokiarchaeota archaeon]|nr:hypothetical protein [Candidatus Lokiarchaeota archaeon]